MELSSEDLAAVQAVAAAVAAEDAALGSPSSTGPSAYRQRASTKFKGVTKTSGTNSGVQKFDVQFVFCDGGTKKHPKLYGFTDATAASRAFDILICKRALEKGKSLDELIANNQNLGANHPLSEYASPAMVSLISTTSRDGIIYGLKAAAKRSLLHSADALLADLTLAIAIAAEEGEERGRVGDVRQSYEPTAKAPGERKRKGAGGVGGPAGRRRQGDSAGALAADGLGHLGELQGLLGSGATAAEALVSQQMLLQFFASSQVLPSLLQPLQPPGVAPLPQGGDDPEAGEAAGGDGGLAMLLELCRAGSHHVAEAACVSDLVRIWEALNRGAAWEGEAYTLPATYYQPHIEALRRVGPDLRAALALCHDLWRGGALRMLMSLYVSSLANAQLAGVMMPPPEAGAMPPDAALGVGAAAAADAGFREGSAGAEQEAEPMAVQALLAAAGASAAAAPPQQQQEHAEMAHVNGQRQHLQLQNLFDALHGNEAAAAAAAVIARPVSAAPSGEQQHREAVAASQQAALSNQDLHGMPAR